MNPRTMRRLLCLLTVLLLTAVLALGASAREARFDPEDPLPGQSTTPTLAISYKNLSYRDSTYLLFAVSYENVPQPSQINMIAWTEWDGNDFLKDSLANDEGTFACTYRGPTTINNVPHAVFQSKGLSARMLADVFYVRAYVTVDGVDYYSDVLKFSGLQYMKELAENPNASEADVNLVNALRAYTNAAQIRFNYNLDDLAGAEHGYITTEGATLPDGFCDGLYKYGTSLTITADVPAGDSLARWVDGSGNVLGTENPLVLTVNGDKHVRAILSSSPESCDHVYGDLIPAADATCTEDGCVAHYRCSLCGRDFNASYEVITDAVIPALGHDWVDVEAVAASCIPGHTAYRYCDRCGVQEGYTELPANADHTYVEETVAPSGEIRGYVNHVCSVCGDSYRSDYDYSLYSGVDFSTEGKYPIPQYFDSQTYTIEAAVQLADTVTSRAGVIMGSYDGTNPAFNLEVYNNGKLRLFFMNSTSEKYSYLFNTDIRVHVEEQLDPEEGEGEGEGSTAAQVPPAVKYLTVTIEPGEAKLYVDGVYAETITMDNFVFPTIGRNLMLGGDNRTGNSQAFQGQIYSVSIYGDVRTDEEIVDDLVLADSTDQHCLFSLNLLSSASVNQGVVLEPVLESAQVTTAEELAYHAGRGTKNIEVMNDIVLDRTVYVISESEANGDSPVTIFSNGDYTILRDPDFYGDMFVIGENVYGRNLLLDDISAELNLGKAGATGTLTIDGNKTNVTGDVFGSLLYVNNSGAVNINGAVLTNNRKVANSRSLGMQQSFANMMGGAAIINANGTVTLNSGTISNCEVNTADISGGDSSAENYRQSMYGGAIYNVSNFIMNGGTISGTGSNAAFFGGAIADRGRCEILGGVIENNCSAAAGGAIYVVQTYTTSLTIGNPNGNATDVIFRNNSSATNGGVVYAAGYAQVLIHGGVTFSGNSATGNGGALYAGTQCSIGENTVFTNNSAKTGGAAYFATVESQLVHKSLEGVSFTGNSATHYAGAVYCNGTELEITDCTFTSNTAGVEGGAIYGAVYSEITIDDSAFIENECTGGHAGAVTLRGSEVTVSDTTFTGNEATGNGGALYVSYTTVTNDNDESTQIYTELNLDRNTFSGNTATNGGALYTATNSTLTGSGNSFTGNTAYALYDGNSEYVDGGLGGGVYFSNSAVSLSCSTFTGNTGYIGAGLYATGGTTTLTDVTATANTAAHVGGFSGTISNTLTIDGTSVIGDTSDSTLGNSSGNNGGALYGNTGARMILEGVTFGYNTAGNAGGAIYVRNHFEATDCNFVNNSGKYGGALFIYSTTDASVDGCTFTGNRATDSYGGAAYINAGTGQTAKLTAQDTSFTGNSAITLGGAVYINAGNELEAAGCTFTGNTAGSYGGAIHGQSGATVDVEDTTFASNTATTGGGAISTYKSSANQTPATVTLTDVTLDANSAPNGGALWLSEANATLSGTATGNYADTGSGGVGYLALGTTLTVDEITATGNHSYSYGGCFYVNRSTLNLTNDQTGKLLFGALESEDPENPVDVEALKNYTSNSSGGVAYATTNTAINVKNAVFANNTAYNYGGAIAMNPADGTGVLTTENAQFIGNRATRTNSSTAYGGGAVFLGKTGALVDTGSTFTGNAGSYGGAIFVGGTDASTASASLSGSTFTENNAPNYDGGAIQLQADATLSCDGVSFSRNTARNGAAINSSSTGAITVSDSVFQANAARTAGGAVNTTGSGALTFTDTRFTGNSAASHGGAVRLYDAAGTETACFTRCAFANNAATGASANGGAIYSASKSVAALTDVSFNGNTSKGGTDNAIYAAGTSRTTIDGIVLYLPCGTPQIVGSSANVLFTIYQNKAFDQNNNALTISDYVSGGTVTWQ